MDENTPPKAKKCLFDVYANEIKRNNKQKEALKEIKEIFDNNDITYMCPKGFVLKSLYEQEELRFMTDIDILIDKENMEKACSLLVSKGYTQKTKSDHDIGLVRKPYIFLDVLSLPPYIHFPVPVVFALTSTVVLLFGLYPVSINCVDEPEKVKYSIGEYNLYTGFSSKAFAAETPLKSTTSEVFPSISSS